MSIFVALVLATHLWPLNYSIKTLPILYVIHSLFSGSWKTLQMAPAQCVCVVSVVVSGGAIAILGHAGAGASGVVTW